jgi:hypothetical protein
MRYLFTKKAPKTDLRRRVADEGPRCDLDPLLDALLLQAWHRERGEGPLPQSLPDSAALRALLGQPRYAHLRVLSVPSKELARFILNWLKVGVRAPTPQGQSSQFCELLHAIQRILTVSDRDLSFLLHIDPATVARWVNGTGAPHPLARDGILFKLAKVAQRKYP